MAYEVWVRLNDDEWTFTEDPDAGTITDGPTVLAGMRFGWSMPGPLWPVQPSPASASLVLNLPDFSAAGLDRPADGDWLAIEVKLDTTDTTCLARFYGDVTDYSASPREGREGVFLSVEAVDYTVRLRETYHPPYVIADDATPWTDQELATDMWARGDETGLAEPGTILDWETPPVTISDSYLNLDGPLPVPVPTFLERLLLGATNTPSAIGRHMLAPLVGPASYAPNHGRLADGVSFVGVTGAYYWLDILNADPLALSQLWEIPGDAVESDSFTWSNIKGRLAAYVTTSGWGGDQQAQTYSPVTGATGVAGEDVPVMINDEVNAQAVSDFYAELAPFDPWQVERFTVPVTRFLRNGGDPRPVGDLNAGLLELFPDQTLSETDAGRAWCYATGLVITDVDPTTTPDGEDFVQGILVGAECVITDSAHLELALAMRRTEIGTPTSTAVTLTVPTGAVSADVTGFVTRVDLSTITAIDWWTLVTTDGGNIRVYDTDGAPVGVPCDVAWINTGTKTGELWFRSDLLTGSDNEFSIAVEVGELMPASTDPLGRNAVWADYEVVVAPGSDYKAGLTTPVDRTGGGAGVSIVGAGVTLTTDGWLWSSTATGYVKITGLAYLGTTFSMGCRCRQNVNDATQRFMLAYASAGNTNGQERVYLKARQVGTDRFAITTNTGGDLLSGALVKPSTYLNTFKRWVVYHNGGTSRGFYVDGGSAGTPAGAATARPSAADALLLGSIDAVSTTSGNWRGEVAGPVYLRNGVLSANWIAAEALSWNSPGSFYAIT